MNERIRELMAQAGFDPASIERMGVMPNAEKFAKLLQQDCLQHLTNMGLDHAREVLERYFDQR